MLFCRFLVFWVQITIEYIDLFHHSVCEYMFDCDVSKIRYRTPMQTEHTFVCNLELHQKKVREKSRECHNHKPQLIPDT